MREWHAITGHDGIEDDVRVRKLLVHAVQRLYELKHVMYADRMR